MHVAPRMAIDTRRACTSSDGATLYDFRKPAAPRAQAMARGTASASESAPSDRRADGLGQGAADRLCVVGLGLAALIAALIYDNWGWAIGTGLMAAFAFLAWPSEVPPRVGLDHEFSVSTTTSS